MQQASNITDSHLLQALPQKEHRRPVKVWGVIWDRAGVPGLLHNACIPCNAMKCACLMQALQSISMAEERQGEAHADGLAKLSSLQASAALQQALALASAGGAASTVAGYGGFAQAPAPAAPENGLAALQVECLHIVSCA